MIPAIGHSGESKEGPGLVGVGVERDENLETGQ
jgi:hypothetical protein